MNVAMLQLGSISSNMSAGKPSLKTGDLKNAFATLLLSHNKSVESTENQVPGNLEDLLKGILQILNGSLSSTGRLDFTSDSKISEKQISDLLGMKKDDWKAELNDVTDSLVNLLANFPQLMPQMKDAKKALDEGNYLEGISELISAFSKLPPESIQQLKPNQLQSIAKNAKAVEMLTKTVDLSMSDIKQLTQLKDSMQNVMTKIEQLLKNSKSQTRNAILQNSFTNILKDQQNGPSETAETKESDTSVQNSIVTNSMNPISKMEQFVLHVGKETPTNYNQFVKDFSNILAKSQLTAGLDGTNKLLIKLYPEHLGSLRIELLQDKGIITAKLIASSGAAKDMLDSQMHQLKDAFTIQNIQVDKINVVYGQTEAQKFGQSDPRQQSSNHEREAPKQENEEDSETQFSNLLSESLLEKII
jgi:flagellar hook-length control protein FliK